MVHINRWTDAFTSLRIRTKQEIIYSVHDASIGFDNDMPNEEGKQEVSFWYDVPFARCFV
jgi:hypothetical protein